MKPVQIVQNMKPVQDMKFVQNMQYAQVSYLGHFSRPFFLIFEINGYFHFFLGGGEGVGVLRWRLYWKLLLVN